MTVVSPVISLPNSQSAALLPTSQPIQRQYATLPRKGNANVVIGGTLGRSPAPMPPRRDPKTTLSVGRARARSMVAGLGKRYLVGCSERNGDANSVRFMVRAEGGGERDDRDEITSTGAKSSSAESIHLPQQPSTGPNTGQNTPVQPRTASIRSRPTSSRITAAELEVHTRITKHIPLLDHERCASYNLLEWHCTNELRLQLCPSFLPGTISAAAR